ncbi:META domain-containing protein [Desulfosarcina cetonica]|uniref:META domain-containing protein n=1 Tax=Desulfosarcina cetonica TaxID=90730 RepID=UPI00248B783E|nr:META domain-containing protein [Desulfosarcina cetonica]
MAGAGCAGGTPGKQDVRTADPQSVVGKTWQWESTITPVEKISVPEPERYTLLLMADGKARVRFDCNRGGGDYKIAAGQLTFGPLISTRMACPQDSLDAPFMRDLQRAASFFVQDGRLFLELPYDSGTMRFRSSPGPVELLGTVVYMDLEGGFFAIKDDDGKTYEPVNLPETFKKNGLQVRVTARVRDDVGSIHMVGEIIEIVTITQQ